MRTLRTDHPLALGWVLALLFIGAGCGGRVQASVSTECRPGASEPCICGAGDPGVRTCDADGLQWSACGCTQADGGSDVSDGAYDAVTDADGTAEAGVPCGAFHCGALEECGTVIATGTPICVSRSVALPAGFTIDATETTFRQYQAWLATGPSTASLPPYCSSWKSSYHSPSGSGDYPVDPVDWCDAYGFCSAIGKRMCGKIGGGSVSFGWSGECADATKSQWFNACASGDLYCSYPYCGEYSASKCNTYWQNEPAEQQTVPVGSLLDCTSNTPGYLGVYDLSGNVLEWEDSCDGTMGQDDRCNLRGGSFGGDGSLGGTSVTCYWLTNSFNRGYFSDWHIGIGIRCCSDS